MKRGGIWVGTSGWSYKEWAGHFYPKGWPKKNEFSYYVRHFPTVEINATFYRLPTKKTVRGWRERSPERFVFAVKGSRYLTHIRRLKDTGKGLQKYFRRLTPLGDRAGPILWQLPPTFQKNDVNWGRLTRFLARVPRAYRHAVEFRHPSWMDEQTFELLRQNNVCNVWISSLKMPMDYTVTSDFIFLRFHGLEGGAYHDYTDDELRPWAEQLGKAARKNIPAFVYFNNDLNTRAPLNGHAMMRLVGRHAVQALAPDPDAKPLELAPPKKGPETWRSWMRSKEAAPAATRPKNRRPAAKKKKTPAASRRYAITAPAQAGPRRFAAAPFSASALPPAR
ncbi:MAG TPA: DUF72 domain-containing protein [Opitutaceae bacterium]|nr:DUF72 domain-containing protein [Opitutaceae bacterium]